jgi:competence protein ComGC
MALKLSSIVDKKQFSLFEFIAVIVIIALLMKAFMDLFLEQQSQVTNSAFSALIQRFSTKVNVVHSVWLTSGQPNMVFLAPITTPMKTQLSKNNNPAIMVNSAGWVDDNHPRLACQRIWQYVLMTPRVVVNSQVIVVDINRQGNMKERVCRYSIASGLSFDYYTQQGRVVIKR